MDRRNFLTTSTTAVLGSSTALAATPLITSDAMRPQMAHGVQSGDPQTDGAIIWTRSDRPARLWLDWSTTAIMANATRVRGPFMLEDSDYTGRLDLRGLPAGQEIFYRVILQDLHNERVLSEALPGHLRLPAAALGGKATRDVRFAWSGDTAGQGWGINEAWGGMKIYEQMRQVRPDFFLHCGDTIYADGPITAQVKLADGSMWNNIVTEEVSKVAESLNEFCGRYRYNLMDANVRRMAAEVPQIWQWDDHEVTNNWSDAKDLAADKRYTEKNLPLLTARAKATWKVISADMPIGLHVGDGKDADGRNRWEASANGDDGAPLGREIEIARLLGEIKKANIHNVVWLTADVHYTAAHYFDPSKAQFSNFEPFWEFVSGPLNAGGFGPNKVDATFGMQVVYQKAPDVVNAPPTNGMQFFGQVDIDAKTKAMTVTLKDLAGAALYTKTLAPQRG